MQVRTHGALSRCPVAYMTDFAEVCWVTWAMSASCCLCVQAGCPCQAPALALCMNTLYERRTTATGSTTQMVTYSPRTSMLSCRMPGACGCMRRAKVSVSAGGKCASSSPDRQAPSGSTSRLICTTTFHSPRVEICLFVRHYPRACYPCEVEGPLAVVQQERPASHTSKVHWLVRTRSVAQHLMQAI